MCGICGMLMKDPQNPVSRDLLGRMNATLVHRGPDDEGYYCGGPVGLAMRRLSIIDLESGKQPISNEDGGLTIVFNGEIYNFLELREELKAKGHVFRTRSDTEVIVHLYEEFGADCVTKLNGMFAFALWDSRNRTLFIARDRLGIKPLFFAENTHGDFFFGSEIKAVLQTDVDRTPDLQAIHDYLSLLYVPTPATAYRSIRKLPPGHHLTICDSHVRVRQYWDVPLPEDGASHIGTTDHEAETLELIERCVRRHMIADVPVGALLSGGLDSTTVTAIMAARLDVKVRTFTMGFGRKSYDESAEAALVAKTLGTDHIEKRLEPEMIHSIPDLLNMFDEPFADYSAIPTYMVSKLAARHLKVVLTGDGGDEVFAGYPTHTAYRVSRVYRMLPRFLRDRLIQPLVRALPTSMERISFDYMAKRFVTGADLPYERGHYWWKVIFNEDEKRELLQGDFRRTEFEDSFGVFERYFNVCAHAHPLNRLLYVDLKTFLPDDNLTKVDRMTMANSLEARVPLLDHELVEKVALMPPLVKSRGLETKGLLRRAVKDLLPPSIRKGRKKGFTPPLPHWIGHELQPFFVDTFKKERIAAVGLLNPTYCSRLLQEHFEGRVDNNRQIWTITALIHWLERNSI